MSKIRQSVQDLKNLGFKLKFHCTVHAVHNEAGIYSDSNADSIYDKQAQMFPKLILGGGELRKTKFNDTDRGDLALRIRGVEYRCECKCARQDGSFFTSLKQMNATKFWFITNPDSTTDLYMKDDGSTQDEAFNKCWDNTWPKVVSAPSGGYSLIRTRSFEARAEAAAVAAASKIKPFRHYSGGVKDKGLGLKQPVVDFKRQSRLRSKAAKAAHTAERIKKRDAYYK